jgi:hypothetical protein
MKKETIEKLHEIEEKRKYWEKFRDSLRSNNNISVASFRHTPSDIVCSIGKFVDGYQELYNTVYEFVLRQIKKYNDEIERL